MKKKILIGAVGCLTLITTTMVRRRMLRKRKRRAIWSRKWLMRRNEGRGLLNLLNQELLIEDIESYRNFLRLDNQQFEKILTLIVEDIQKEDTFMRDSISPRNRLEVTLRFLATGESFRSLMYSTRIHESTISKFIPEVCRAIYNHLKGEYLEIPTTPEAWKTIADNYYQLWQFPNCLGALDGRHIKFCAPISSGSFYYNYKGTNSIVLLGLADANYKFIYVNVGVNGRVSDGGVFRESKFSKVLQNNNLNFPEDEVLPGNGSEKLPYVVIADDAFPLSTRLLKPYAQRGLCQEQKIFNYRLSRARRMIESTFGILVNRFRVLRNPICLNVEKVELITLTCIVLHNFLVTSKGTVYTDIDPDEKLDCMGNIGNQGGNRCTVSALRIRDKFKDYFCTVGAVPWQNEAVNNCNM